MIRNGVRIPFKSGPPAAFHQGVSMEDATPDQWRLIINLRPLNWYSEERDMSFETLTRLRHLAGPGDYMLFTDLQGGFYAVGIAPEDRDYCTVNYRDKPYRLAGLPMGWSLSPYYFCSLTAAFNRHLRRPDFAVNSQRGRRAKLSKLSMTSSAHFRGCRMLPYMDDFMFFASSRA
eukprot:jgi/Tetstr1/423238/TSEL_001356.t1